MRILSIDSGTKNNAVVKLDINDNKIKIIDTQLFNFCGNKKVKQCSFEDIIKNLIVQFSQYDCKDVDIVLIENIPTKLNMITKSLSIATYTHFLINGIQVKLISPSRKLSKEQNKLSYKERKQAGIKKCFDLIDKDDKLDIMEKYKFGQGLADVSDCIIQAWAWFQHQK
jgi:hypothetical protein